MSNQFYLDNSDIKKLAKFYKQSLRIFQKASAGVLNSMAFGTRPFMIDALNIVANIRKPAFVKKALRVKKAKLSDKIDSQFSEVGSVRDIARHESFESLESGKSVRATAFLPAGRVGGTGVSIKQARAGQNQTEIEDTAYDTIPQYLQHISRDKNYRRKPFYLHKQHRRLKRGVYKFVGGKVGTFKRGDKKYRRTLVGAKLMRLSIPKHDVTPKATHWRIIATKKSITERRVKDWWVDNFQRTFERELKRNFRNVRA